MTTGTISWIDALEQHIRRALDEDDLDGVHAILAGRHPADVADVIDRLGDEDKLRVFRLLAPAQAADPAPVPYPTGYRDWHHVKSMVIEQGHPLYAAFGGIHHHRQEGHRFRVQHAAEVAAPDGPPEATRPTTPRTPTGGARGGASVLRLPA